jgi:phosphate transport system protein
MAALSELAVAQAVKALTDRLPDLAQQVISGDEEINRLEIQVDERCMRILALFQPEAKDLRFLAMALKTNKDLERVGDLAVSIAGRSLLLLQEPPLKPLLDIPRLAVLAREMLKDSLDAFVKRDAEAARRVCQRDDQVDELNEQVFRELLTHMLSDTTTIKRAINLIMVSRSLERVADHATNVAEEVIYMVEGKDIKHHMEKQHG